MNLRSGIRPALLLCAVSAMGLTACIEPNPSHDGIGNGTGADTSTPTNPSSTDGATESGAEGMDASADGGTSSGPTSSSATTGDGDGDGDGGTSDDPFTTTGDGTESLWHYNDIAECQRPLWCYIANQGPFTPAGGELWAFECFDSGLAPPITIYKFAYEVVANDPQLQGFELQLRTREADGGPGTLLNSRPLDPADFGTVNSHGIDVGWTIDTPEFCIGFHAPAGGLGSALGLAVDETSTVQDVSWFRVDDGSNNGGCTMNDLRDVIDNQPTPTGNWCFAVAVSNESMP